MNIVYLRVSKEDEKEQDPTQQLNAIVEKYSLSEYKLYEERGSAWDLSKINKREKFLDILNICFDSKTKTIEDLYLGTLEKKNINIYVWDYSRIMRNIELNLLFSMLSYWAKVKIHSFKDKAIFKEEPKETPTRRMARIMMNTISAFSSEEYSYTISENTKKSYKGGFSTYGNKWGAKFRGTVDNPRNDSKGKVDLTAEEIEKLTKYISANCYKPYALVVRLVAEEFKLKISEAYVGRIKRGK